MWNLLQSKVPPGHTLQLEVNFKVALVGKTFFSKIYISNKAYKFYSTCVSFEIADTNHGAEEDYERNRVRMRERERESQGNKKRERNRLREREKEKNREIEKQRNRERKKETEGN